jgi:hypothetical protein
MGGQKKKGPGVLKRAAAAVGKNVMATRKLQTAVMKNVISRQQAAAKKFLPKAVSSKMIATQNKILAAGAPKPVLVKAQAKGSIATALDKFSAAIKAKGTNTAGGVVKKASVVATRAITSPLAKAAGGSVAVAKRVAKTLPVPEAKKQEVVQAAVVAEKMKAEVKNQPAVIKAEVEKKADAMVAATVEKVTEPVVEAAVKSAPTPEAAEAFAEKVDSPVEATEKVADAKAEQTIATEAAAADAPTIDADEGMPEAIVEASDVEANLPGDTAAEAAVTTSEDSDIAPGEGESVSGLSGLGQTSGYGATYMEFVKKNWYWFAVGAAVIGGGIWWMRRSRALGQMDVDTAELMLGGMDEPKRPRRKSSRKSSAKKSSRKARR